jgi:thioredoxin 1
MAVGRTCATPSFCDHRAMHSTQFTTNETLLVACLCADWCGTCREYRPLFNALQREFPQTRFVWIDVEDDADLVDPIEVDDFPTLLIAAHGEPLFFGPVMPHQETLRRLIQTHREPGKPSLAQAPDVRELIRNILKSPDPGMGDLSIQ